MKIQVKEKSPGERVLTVSVEAAEVEAAYQRAFHESRKHLRVKGFRKGNVPDAIAKQYLTDAHLVRRVVNAVVPPAYKEAIKEAKLNPLGKPDWELKESQRGKDLVFEATLQVMPILPLTGYKDLGVEPPSVTIEPEKVEQVLLQRQQGAARYHDRAPNHQAQSGDFCFIDYQASYQGEPLPQAQVKNFLLELSPDKFLPGFVERLLGVRAGEVREFPLSLPENYAQPKLAGQEVSFKVKVHQIKERRLPALDDEFAKAQGQVETIAQLRESVRSALYAQAKLRAEDELVNEIIRRVVEQIDVRVIPPQLQEGHARLALRTQTQNLERQGLTLEQFLEKRGISQDHFSEELRLTGLVEARLEVFYRSLAVAENIQVLNKEVDQAIIAQASNAGKDPKVLKAQMLKEDTFKVLAYRILISKIRRFLLEAATAPAPQSKAPAKAKIAAKGKAKKATKSKTSDSSAKAKKTASKAAAKKKTPARNSKVGDSNPPTAEGRQKASKKSKKPRAKAKSKSPRD